MDYESFNKWLISIKSMSERSAHDVVSRLKRALYIAQCDACDPQIFEKLEKNAFFDELTLWVKSQLRRAVTLYKEFTQSKGN